MSFDVFFEADDDESVEDVFLAFRVGAERYAVCVVHVLEIVRLREMSHVPRMPPAFAGVMNLRGQVVPVLDMQACFCLGETPRTDRTIIVVLENEGEHVGMMVEEVTEVLELEASTMEPARSARGTGGGLVRSVAQTRDEVYLVLDLPVLFDEAAGGEAVETRRNQP